MTEETLNSKVPALPGILGYLGLLPFVFFAVTVWIAPDQQIVILNKLLLTYAACILAFMGAVHWGYAMVANANSWQLGLSVLPALLGWLALNMPSHWGYSVLIVSFVILCFADGRATQNNLAPAWYPRLRTPLTIVVILSLISGAFGVLT